MFLEHSICQNNLVVSSGPDQSGAFLMANIEGLEIREKEFY
jgi:hypothetical protein